MKRKLPLIVCYKDIIVNEYRKVHCVELMRVQQGDLVCLDFKDKVIATFHHDCLEWVVATPKAKYNKKK